MFKPLFDILNYIKIFQSYLGFRMYIIYFLGIISSFLEGIGILMLLPLLQSIDSANPQSNQSEFEINKLLNDLISFLGFSQSISSILILISFAFIIKGIITFLSLGTTAYLIGELLKKIKLNLFNLYSNMRYEYYTSKNTGELINLVNEQPTRSLEAFKQLSLLGSHFINTTVLMTLAFVMTFSFGLIAVLLGALLLLLFLRLNKYVQKLSRINAEENGILTKWLVQFIHGYKYLISTNQLRSIRTSIEESVSVLTKTQIKTGIAAAFTQSIREPIAVLFIMVIIAVQIFYFGLKLEPVLVSIALFYRALNSTLAVQSSFQATFQYIGSMELVDQEFRNQIENQAIDGKNKIDNLNGGISIKQLSFTYENSNQKVLDSISIDIKNKSSIAIVGESGAGKTTLIDLITLVNEPSQGKIFINGVPSSKILKKSWRDLIGYVSQDNVIFDDTIANNISMWKNFSKSNTVKNEIIEAAKKANIYDFIISLPNGFDTLVGDRGVMLSGGQKQRIFIAREIFRKPKLLILDEATSSLDSESEKSIQESIDSLKGKLTVIIVAHRLSTIKKVDQIYLLSKGKIIEQGRFDDLKNNSKSKFSKLVNLQDL